MHHAANTVTRAMHEIIAIAPSHDHSTRDVIDFTALCPLALRHALASEGDTSITRLAHNLEDLALSRRNLFARPRKGHPGIIGDNSIRLRQPRPEVEQHQVAAPYRTAIA